MFPALRHPTYTLATHFICFRRLLMSPRLKISEILAALFAPASVRWSRSSNRLQYFPFVNRDVIRLIALDHVLRIVL